MKEETLLAKLDGLTNLIEEKFKNNQAQHENIKDALNGKACKWVEHFNKGIIGTVMVAVLGAVVALVVGGGTAAALAFSIKTLIV